ncbi:thymidine phosphorylase family protein [Microbulbifer discodermiae]|uniref:thymidine phosphorylase family protein n=1 Tax=Microbulbifer sp. 2201CG32-9 TaxID=3232309 RepID=UPI00345B7F3E
MTSTSELHAHLMGIDTHEEPIAYLSSDCDICRAEGFAANTRLRIQAGERSLIATLNTVSPAILAADKIGFSDSAWAYLGLRRGQRLQVSHAPLVPSLSALHKKIYGHRLDPEEINGIIRDIKHRLYSDIEISSFLTANAAGKPSVAEITALTHAMVNCGNRLHWPEGRKIYDKHCIGGLPGNRTTPIVVAIASAAGLTIPKTSSRAITSPAGTADTMEVLTQVDLTLEQLRAVVTETGACLAAGGEVGLSPTDDLLIRIERALSLDSPGQLVASVLSKKVAAGSTHVLIDMPVGPTAKLRNQLEAEQLATLFYRVAEPLQIKLCCVLTDGSQAIGYGVGPVQEARDILAVLRNEPDAPEDLRERSLYLSAQLLSMTGEAPYEQARDQAREILASGLAWQQFQSICAAQGGLKEFAEGAYQSELRAQCQGPLISMDNRRLARLAKLAGAPSSPEAGLHLRVKTGNLVAPGQPLATLYAATPGELAYAREYFHHNSDIFAIGRPP